MQAQQKQNKNRATNNGSSIIGERHNTVFTVKSLSITLCIICVVLAVWYTIYSVHIEPTQTYEKQLEEKVKRGEKLNSIELQWIKIHLNPHHWLIIKSISNSDFWFRYMFTEPEASEYFEKEMDSLTNIWWKSVRDRSGSFKQNKDWENASKDEVLKQHILKDFIRYYKKDFKNFTKSLNSVEKEKLLLERKYYFSYLYVKHRLIEKHIRNNNNNILISKYSLFHILNGHILKNNTSNVIETNKSYLTNLKSAEQLIDLATQILENLPTQIIKINAKETQCVLYTQVNSQLYFFSVGYEIDNPTQLVLKTLFPVDNIMNIHTNHIKNKIKVNNLIYYYEY